MVDGMKRRGLQALSKKHGIPANLKNTEMACRLASILKKERKTKKLPEDKEGDNLVVGRVVKKVRFSSPENKVFELTRSVKKRRQKNVRQREIGVRRSTRITSKVVNVAESSENELNTKSEIENAKRIGSSCRTQEDECRVLESQVEKAPRRSKRLGNDVNLLMDENDKAVKNDEQPKRNDCKDKKLPRRSKRTALDSMNKLNVNDEMQVRFRFTRKSSRNGSCKAPMLVEKKTDAPIIKSSKLVAKRMKQGRTAEPEMEVPTAFTQTNLTPEKLSEEYSQAGQEEASCAIVEARGFTKKPKTMSQECVKDSPSETKAAESVTITENILDPTLENLAETSQRKNSQELKEILFSISSSELKEHSFVTEAEVIMENSAECWNDIHSCKDDEKGSLEKKTQEEANLLGSEKEQAEISKAACISAGHCVNREAVDEVKHDSVEKSERTLSSERGCNALKLSTEYADLSPREENVSDCLEKVQMKTASNTLDELAVSTAPESNLMLMEQLSEDSKIHATKLVTLENDEAIESHAIVFTTPEIVLSLEDSVVDETKKEYYHAATEFPNESDVFDSGFMLGGSRKNEAGNEGEGENHGEANIATGPVSLSNAGGFKGDGMENNEEKKTAESAFVTWVERLFLEGSGQETMVAALNFGESTDIDSNGCTASNVFYSPEFYAQKETAGGSCRSIDIENRLNDAHEALTMNGNNEADELMEANLLLDLSGNSSVSEKTCVLARTEDEHLGFESEALEDVVTSPLATAFEEAVSPTLDEFTIQHNSNEEA